ncbi:fructooligosaccharide transport system permease protein [Paenibacillus endophyticus]|uniref:Fructooligosaccharide transport system permease protein n=1 Tax=Paenibacillus endophyticus TaxID=1294268 RepID=A0A7W5CAU0_9BACL|nr:sugar ABC transporter permease [Paenibacillus endophyticus]MBB3154177.1 fructooligosaccharide transport system permease protein [Paenibacillus endophyticus]
MNTFTLGLIAVFILILAVCVLWDIRKSGEFKFKWSHSLAGYLFMAPALVLIVLFVIQPIVLSLWYGFTDYYLLEPNNIHYIGLNNFSSLTKDLSGQGDFYHALKNTLYFMLFCVPLQIAVALGLALLVNKPRKGGGFFKVAFFSPVVMSLAVTSFLWLYMLRPDEKGLINGLLVKMGIPVQGFFTDPDQAMNLIILLSAWQGAGMQMIIFLAGLKNISRDLYEAAQLDGANRWKSFLNITMPGLKPITLFILITTFIAASRLMIQPMILTGYKEFTVTLSYLIYNEGYVFKMVGYASAIALLVTVLIGSMTLVQRYVLREVD